MYLQIKKDWQLLCKVIPKERDKVDKFIGNESIEKLIRFLIVAEDHRYKYHWGFDMIAITRACHKRVFFKTREGASTIEQQLVRVITNDYNCTLRRKLKEIILAFLIKFIIDKKHTALVYLNIAYYGTNYQNLDAILAKFGLHKGSILNDKICSEIIARLKYPEPQHYNKKRLKQIERRKQHILRLYRYYSTNKTLNIWLK